MSFGLPGGEKPRLTYGGYLSIGELLSLQRLHSDPRQHDETLFIIIHQVYELWFKQLLHELDTVMEHLNSDEPLSAHRLVRRCIEIERVLVNQIAVLETMTPMDFLAFRDRLMPASGFQSAQFRELEFICGIKEPRMMKSFPEGSPDRAKLEARLAAPTLGDAFYGLLRRRGFTLPEDATDSVNEARVLELARIYREPEKHYDLFLLAESLIEMDEVFSLWRLTHIKMVERMIGGKTGTGGTEGAVYLRKTVDRQFFPELWELRSHLSFKGGA